MKLRFTLCSFVLSAALVAPAFATELSPTSKTDPIVTLGYQPAIAEGMLRETVTHMFGLPGAKISPDVWVYWEFKARDVPGSEICDAVVVGFKDDRVNYLRLTRSEYVRAFIAQQQAAALKASGRKK